MADETAWLTQKLIGVLFEATVPTVNEHLANLYQQGEIAQSSTIRNFRTVQKEGNREVSRNIEFYNLKDDRDESRSGLNWELKRQ